MNLYQHFRPDEREFIDQVLNWKQYVEETFAPKLTDFLDPREQQIVRVIIGENHDSKVQLFGGTSFTERKRALIYPSYFEPEEDDFHINLFKIIYPKKFITIEHRQVLGTLMSLGLVRSKYGDILMDEETVQFFCTREVVDYVELNLTSIGKATISLQQIEHGQAIVVNDEWVESTTTTSSLRLDAIISASYNISRQKAQTLVRSKLVKINWKVVEDTSFECGVGDVFSIRGLGRMKLLSIEGKTKKDKWRTTIGKQK